MKIAITGGIGSGKSTVARVARDMGFKVASCDDTYARLCRDADSDPAGNRVRVRRALLPGNGESRFG